MSLGDFLDALGIKAGVILAGFGGSVARIAFFGNPGASILATLLAVIGGTITAMYLGPVGPVPTKQANGGLGQQVIAGASLLF